MSFENQKLLSGSTGVHVNVLSTLFSSRQRVQNWGIEEQNNNLLGKSCGEGSCLAEYLALIREVAEGTKLVIAL